MNFVALKICLVFIITEVSTFGQTNLFNTHDEPPTDFDDFKSISNSTVSEKWIKQRLDHFNEGDLREWNMRYLENDIFFQAGKVECENSNESEKS